MHNDNLVKIKLFSTLIVAVIAVVAIYNIVIVISRLGETKIEVDVLPKSSTITVNGNRIGSTIYLGNGEYEFKAMAPGYNEDSFNLTLKNNQSTTPKVILLPEPVSSDILNQLAEDPVFQAQREALGSEKSNLLGSRVINKNPFVSQLPYTDILGPFTIDYSLEAREDGRLNLIIKDSSPKGRSAALQWIRNQGADPTDYSITFEDFNNPLSQEFLDE